MGLRDRTNYKEYRCFFVTTTCNSWLNLLTDDGYYSILSDSIQFCCKKYKANTVGFVFMPNHIHFILFFMEENYLSDFMRDFKKFTSGEIRRKIERDGRLHDLSLIRYEHEKQKFKVWQDRFDDLHLISREVLEIKLNYIHQNPVKKGLVEQAEDYKWSSAAYYRLQQESPIPILHYMEIM